MLVRLATHAMGTRFELVLEGEDSGSRAEANLRAAGEEALLDIEEVDQRLSLFRRSSLLAHIVRNAGKAPVQVDPDTFALLTLCSEVNQASEGAFDPTIAPLMRAYGLHDEGAITEALPLDVARRQVGWQKSVQLDPARQQVRFLKPEVALDLGAIAKGHALDLAGQSLRDAGVTRALLHGGTSTIMAIGCPLTREAWPIALGSQPKSPRVHLRDQALSVSAPHSQSVQHEGQRIGHVLDPRIGKPSSFASVAATLCSSAAAADAWSTALLVNANSTLLPPTMESLLGVGHGKSNQPHQWLHRPAFTLSRPDGFQDIPLSLETV